MPITTPGRLDVTLKINQMPAFEIVENGWKQFYLDCDGKIVVVKMRPKIFKRIEEAVVQYPMWIAVITGKIGILTNNGFILDSPVIQNIFERKQKLEDLTS